MTNIDSDNTVRHAPADVIEAYYEQGVSGTLVVDGTPKVRVQIVPHHRRLSLLVQADANSAGPDLRDRANLAYDLQREVGVKWHRLDVTFDDNLTEVYPVLCTIADRVQLGGESFKDAVEAVLAGLGDILAGRGGLSRAEQVGLFGELIALLSLTAQSTPTDAVAAWRGPEREEHDFGLLEADVEVKTTTSERRSHWISSLTQLQSTPGRYLYLLSLQITAAANGPGATLTELVRAVRALPGVPVADFEKGLESVGWSPRHADLYQARWTLRTAPSFYLVDNEFPALTPARVAVAMPSPARLTDVRYRVDLEGLVATTSLFPVTLTGVTET